MTPPVLTPGPDHPITVTPTAGRVVVRRGEYVVADTRRALTLQESTYPAVQYVPREDADPTLLERTEHSTHCPYKGDASYFTIAAGDRAENVEWSYEQPHEAVAQIREHLAFYPDQVEITVEP
jgi:uncharacterized protein (DUF427 family)